MKKFQKKILKKKIVKFLNEPFIQVDGKYFFFPSPKGEKPAVLNFVDAIAKCEDANAELAYPSNEEENNAIKSFIEKHCSGNAYEGQSSNLF